MTGELVVPEPREIVIPGTGELVSLDDPRQAARALNALDKLKAQVEDARRALQAVVLEESDRQGTNRVAFDDGTLAEVSRGSDLVWDVAALRAGLEEAGLPQDRMEALLRDTVETKVVAVVANELARVNPAYAEVIDRCRQRVAKRPSVKVLAPEAPA